jgi:ankyrin repeat protein
LKVLTIEVFAFEMFVVNTPATKQHWFEAVKLGHFSIMKELIQAGYINATNEEGLSAYHITDNPEIKQFLKINGATTNETKYKASKEFVKFAMRRNNVAWNEFDFTDIDLNEFKDEFESAVIEDKHLRVRLFVANGFKITNEFVYAKTPKMWSLLKELGADINAVNENGTPVIIRVLRGKEMDNLEFLIKLGCDINVKDKNGKTIFDYGYENEEQKKLRLLEQISNLVKQL